MENDGSNLYASSSNWFDNLDSEQVPNDGNLFGAFTGDSIDGSFPLVPYNPLQYSPADGFYDPHPVQEQPNHGTSHGRLVGENINILDPGVLPDYLEGFPDISHAAFLPENIQSASDSAQVYNEFGTLPMEYTYQDQASSHPEPAQALAGPSQIAALAPAEPTPIPLAVYKPQQPFQPYILVQFRQNGRPFVRVKDVMGGRCEGLERSNEIAFSWEQTTNPKMSLRILWPRPETGGVYEDYNNQITLKNAGGSVVSTAKVVQKVAVIVQKFVEKNRGVEYGDPQWKLGPGYILFDDIVLYGLIRVAKSSIVPVLGLLPVRSGVDAV
ncbi:hypothetical protein BKA93DRAFT_414277 [Sparassis latifolia]